jgi:hypothetical protein
VDEWRRELARVSGFRRQRARPCGRKGASPTSARDKAFWSVGRVPPHARLVSLLTNWGMSAGSARQRSGQPRRGGVCRSGILIRAAAGRENGRGRLRDSGCRRVSARAGGVERRGLSTYKLELETGGGSNRRGEARQESPLGRYPNGPRRAEPTFRIRTARVLAVGRNPSDPRSNFCASRGPLRRSCTQSEVDGTGGKLRAVVRAGAGIVHVERVSKRERRSHGLEAFRVDLRSHLPGGARG